MKKYTYEIKKLDCANCAREVEESLNQNKDFLDVKVNFATSKISYKSEKEFEISELNKLIKKVEPDAYVVTSNEDKKNNYSLISLILGVSIGCLAYFLNIPSNLKKILFIISYILLLSKTFTVAIKVLIKNKTVNENMLITISSIGAFLLGNVLEGMMVVVLYLIGKILEEKAIANSRKNIKELMDITEPNANLVQNNVVEVVSTTEVKVGDILLVKKGEKVPVDGKLISEKGSFDSSSLTGEAMLLNLSKGDNVLSGYINQGEVIKLEVTSTYENSTVYKILELIELGENKKTKTETLVNKISKVYTPIVMFLSLLIIFLLPLIFNTSFSKSIYRALTFLVISCPCAIAISVPLSYFTSLGSLSREGVLVKGSNYLDNLSNVKNIIFDKTGTLTKGMFSVSDIIVEDMDKLDNYNVEDIKDILFKGESLSNHPIAKSIVKLCPYKINNKDIKNFKEISGTGISFNINNDFVTIGSNFECTKNGLIHMHINNKHVASIILKDEIKDNAKKVIDLLKNENIKTYMFTGDKKDISLEIANEIGIDEVKYEMLPSDKFEFYDEVKSGSGITIFVGDGINDAPVLKRADIGISMGMLGSDSAIEASDIVLISDDISKIPYAIKKSKFTRHIITENLIFALLVKIIILILSLFGLTNMWFAVFADTGVTLLTILNTLRIIKS